jgi:hypothetical protein
MDLSNVIRQVVTDWNPDIPDTVIHVAAELMRDCLAVDYHDRPLFDDILEQLKAIEFKLITGVNPVEITEFVAAVEYWECFVSIHNPDELSKTTAFVNAGIFDERIQHLIKFYHQYLSSRTSKWKSKAGSVMTRNSLIGANSVNGLIKKRASGRNANWTAFSFVILNDIDSHGLKRFPFKHIDDHHNDTIHSI